MQLIKNKGILIFWLSLVVNCYFVYENHHVGLQLISSTASLLILLIYLFSNSRKNFHSTTKTLVFIGLLSSWGGQLLRVCDETAYFKLAGVCFIISHFIFGIAFYRIHRLKLQKCQEAFIASLVLVFITYELYNFVESSLENNKIIVLAYMGSVSLMCVLAVNLLSTGMRKTLALNFFIPGSILLILSLTITTIGFKFKAVDFLPIAELLSFGYAQALFTEGFTKMLKG